MKWRKDVPSGGHVYSTHISRVINPQRLQMCKTEPHVNVKITFLMMEIDF